MSADRLETLIAESRALAETADARDAGWQRLARAAQAEGEVEVEGRARRASLGDRLLVPALAFSVAMLALAIRVRRPGAPARPQSLQVAQVARARALPSGEGWEPVALGAVGELRQRRGSHVTVPPVAAGASPRIALAAGEICAQVAHRPPGQVPPLLVEAPGLTVEVIGTRFCVAAEAAVTTVSVQEGRVRVTFADGHAASVGAGDSVSTAGRATLGSEPASAPVEAVTAAQRAPGPGSARPPSLTPSTIGQQNALFGKATAAEANGDVAEALELVKDYQRAFPDGLFAPEVAAEARRLTAPALSR